MARRESLGKGKQLTNLKRRSLFNTLLVLGGVLVALLLALYITYDRKGALLVVADQPGAMVMVSGSVTKTPAGTLMEGMRADTYTISVFLDGFRPQPSEQIIQVRGGKTAQLTFRLIPYYPDSANQIIPSEQSTISKKEIIPSPAPAADRKKNIFTPERKQSELKIPTPPAATITEQEQPDRETSAYTGSLKITTQPVQGSIFVDDQFRGLGEVTIENAEPGEVVVMFGEVQGYKTPASQKVFVSAGQPTSFSSVYLPLIFISAYLDQSGRIVAQKCELKLGFAFSDAEFQEDKIVGPGIKFLDEIKAFAWELGYAYSNRNPPGQDVMEMRFDLPDNFDGNKALELRLYGFASDRKYPFAVGGKTQIDLLINGKVVQNNLEPRSKLSEKSTSSYDSFSINSYLKVGKNVIRIQASPSSRCFYYLTKIVLL